MKQQFTRRALLAGTGATVIGTAVSAVPSALGQVRGEAKGTPKQSRYALIVDLNRCAAAGDCHHCIEACHVAHNVPSLKDPRHEVKWLWKMPYARVFPEQIQAFTPPARRQLPVLVTCNHCSSPPCVRVCPTRATWKRADGIVAMDPHRCLGCRYCMAACPYGARSFNWENPPQLANATSYPQRSAGVAEKCTLCMERVDVGQPPVCVQACINHGRAALVFGDLANPDSHVAQLLATRQVLRRKPQLGTEPNVYYLV